MNKKRTYYLIVFIVLSVCIIVFFRIYLLGRNVFSECSEFYTGNVIVRLTHPDNFVHRDTLENLRSIRLYNEGELILIIDEEPFEMDFDRLIEREKIDMDLEYVSPLFMGYEAAYKNFGYGTPDANHYYKIPFGNRIITIAYYYGRVSQVETSVAESILKTVSLSINPDGDIKQETVKECY